MATITIDTNDDVKTLTACRNMLSELVGDDRLDTGALSAASGLPVHAAQRDEAKTAAQHPQHYAAGTPERSEVAEQEGTAETHADQVDTNGVPFKDVYCGKAKEPFYSTGARKGQWKKRKGVTDESYDSWYKRALEEHSDASGEPEDSGQVDTAGAFGAKTDAPAITSDAPTDCGGFMGWVSAKQAAGLLTQEDIGAAYTESGVIVTDLFPPNSDETVSARVGDLYRILAAKAGA